MQDIYRRLNTCEKKLPETLSTDTHVIRRDIQNLKRGIANSSKQKSASDSEKKLSAIEKRISASENKVTARKSKLPEVTFNPDLPIAARKDEIAGAIKKHQVLIISGETGSGKTTQLPKICLEAGRGIRGKIACTQPRRIAAVSVAQRIAEEMGEDIGNSVGYKVRFRDRTNPAGYIKLLTDGMLLAETQNDPYLNEYDTIIVDEAHERSLNIDFIIGILIGLVRKRKDLKVIITSATIDTEKFSKAFNDAPVIEVSGRMFPVEVRYAPPEDEDDAHTEMAARAVDRLYRESHTGDILIFMPSEQDIRETCELIEGRNHKNATILPLYARLSASDQSRVFASCTGRKIVVATNVAETSLTIPGIKYVIDSGVARIAQYIPRSRTTALPVLPVSKSSADQRKGRCGRVENGICIRLFEEEDYESRPLFTPPEVLRANLAEVILRMIHLRLGSIEKFPFIDKPAPKSITDGIDILTELGAIYAIPANRRRKGMMPFALTKRGKIMARLPLDPRISRMLIEAQEQGCLDEMVTIAAALTVSDPRERPSGKEQQADQAHSVFVDAASDFATLLNIWRHFEKEVKGARSLAKLKKFTKKNYLSFKRMREWRDLHGQITAIAEEYGFSNRSEIKNTVSKAEMFNEKYTAIHKTILSGFLSNIALKKEKNIFTAAKGRQVMIFPGSTLFNRAGDWIVSADMIETSRLYTRVSANIDGKWLEEAGGDLCKSTYFEPHWEKNRGEVVGYEKVTLFGLVIIPKRPVSYGKINPAEASEIFIRSALVGGEVKSPMSFMAHNRKMMDEIEDIENKIRRRDLLAGEEDLYQFYSKKVEGVFDIRTLKKRIKDRGGDDFLKMSQEDLLNYMPDEEEISLFPDNVTLGGHSFKCTYKFEPDGKKDGVTVSIPSAKAASVPAQELDWAIPGLRKEKITALIKGLPKEYRKKLVPVPQTVRKILDEMPETDAPLLSTLGTFIYEKFRVDIPATAWPEESLPDHLRMRIALTNNQGKEIRAARDTSILSSKVESSIHSEALDNLRKEWERPAVTGWDFPDLPDSISLPGKENENWAAFPALKIEEGKLALRLFTDPGEAEQNHMDGFARLCERHLSRDLSFIRKDMRLPENRKEIAGYFGGATVFEKRLYDHLVKGLFRKNIRTKKQFMDHTSSCRPRLHKTAQALTEKTFQVLETYHEARSAFFNLETGPGGLAAAGFIQEMRNELSALVPDNFLALYDTDRLAHISRYIKAIIMRAQRGSTQPEKDRIKAENIIQLKDSLNRLLKTLVPDSSAEKRTAVEELFWMLEEYKVSIFAQELKTPVKVSKQRIEKKIAEIDRMR